MFELTIKDNGIGIPENDQQRIFKLFEKLNTQGYKGSGVGLAIVHGNGALLSDLIK